MIRISSKTLFIYYNGYNTFLVNTNEKKIIEGNFIKFILKNSCMYYGCSFKGRLQGSKNLLESKYKLPIIVSELNKIIFFPICYDNVEMWINFNMIKKVERIDNDSIIIFKNGYKKKVFSSYRVINNQILKCSRLWLNYLERK